MKIDDELETVVLCPSDSFLEIGELTLNVWLARPDFKCPVANGQTDVVQPENWSELELDNNYCI